MSTIAPLIALLTVITLIALPIWLILRIVRGRKPPVNIPQPTVGSIAQAHQQPDPASPYARIPTLLTAAERDFFAALQQAVPASVQIFAQVSLAGLVQVKPWARRDKSHWWRIQAKRLDFVLVDAATFALRLVVELDDRSHDRADRRERDAFVDEVLAAAGIPILHIRWQRRYDAGALAEQIDGHLGIAMPAIVTTPLPEPAPAGADSFWRPIPVGSAPAPMSSPPTPALAPAHPVAPMRWACGSCQAELRPNATFCPSCGATFNLP